GTTNGSTTMHKPGCSPKQFLLLAVTMFLPAAAGAQSATWRFEQIYSNPDGNAQFAVVYQDTTSGPIGLDGFTFTSVHGSGEHGHDPGYVSTFDFPRELPSTQTGGRRVLIGTQAFSDLHII